MTWTWVTAAAIGLLATVVIDLWALMLRRAFGVPSLDLSMLGRWTLHSLHGRVVHDRITNSPAMAHERVVGWAAHYAIGVTFGLLFVGIVGSQWLAAPTFWSALCFGIVTVIVPFSTLQPGIGLGFASSRTPHPWRARGKSLVTHAMFGVGLCLGALLVGR